MRRATAFVVGCARSGTSILGEALGAHPEVAYLFEASFVWNALAPQRGDDRLVATDASAEVKAAAPRALEEATQGHPGSVLLEKNPKHVLRIPYLAAIFPGARFIHILRDGRDVVASLMFRNRGESWGHLKVPGWKELLTRYPSANHVRCAHQWREAVRTARQDAADLGLGPQHYLEVRYEELLAEPRTVVGRVLANLGLDLHPSVEAFLPRIQDATEGSYHARRQVRHYVENHSRRKGRYLENLSPEQLRDIEEVCGDLLAELGYLESAPRDG